MTSRCILILPYFGKFNNYFPLFLRSCGANPSIDFLVFTDDMTPYSYPTNVRVVPMTFDEFKANATKRLGFEPCLPTPYKLCDFKPAYGLLFEEYLEGYDYWGHCDCDLLFGNMTKILIPVLDREYDKIFATGHLTLYRNTPENNRRFMKSLHGREIYHEAFSTPDIYVFDENYADSRNPNRLNVHTLFRMDGARVFEEDLAFNVNTGKRTITRTKYVPSTQQFEAVSTGSFPTRFYWCPQGLVSMGRRNDGTVGITGEYLYMHLQSRKMRMPSATVHSPVVEIRPDRFMPTRQLPRTLWELRPWDLGLSNHYWLDVYMKKFKTKLYKERR